MKIANCRGLLKIRNRNDQNCFKNCYIAAYHLHNNINLERDGRNTNAERTSPETYSNPNLQQPLGDFEMPMGFDDMKEFESLNNVQVKVFGFEKSQLYPLRVSNYESSFMMDLLLLYECVWYHYVPITDLGKLVCYVREIMFRYSCQFCRNCFWLCRDVLEGYNLHLKTSSMNAPAVVHMPSPEQSMYKFSKFLATWSVPLVIYFDFESFLQPVASCADPQ